MSREVTVRVPLEESLDLLDRPARACAGFVREGTPRIEPVRLRYEDGRCRIGFEPGAAVPEPSAEVVLVADEGVLFFELRGVYVRGTAGPVQVSEEDGARWVDVEPSRMSSWNYGRMRWKR